MAVENPSPTVLAQNIVTGITISQKSLDAIIFFEVSSPEDYERSSVHPEWPGIGSGITIGVGYDLGYNTQAQIKADWGDLLPADSVARLLSVAGLKGPAARQALTDSIKQVVVHYSAAESVFVKRTLPRYGKDALTAYPGLEQLQPDAVGAIVSLVFNRGSSITDNLSDKDHRRKEMAAIRPLVALKDYAGIARQIRAMKRLWDGVPDYAGDVEQKISGLLLRRDKEADLVQNADRTYQPNELVQILI